MTQKPTKKITRRRGKTGFGSSHNKRRQAVATATSIHPTAIVAKGAQLDYGVVIGPYAIIGPHVEIGSGSRVGAHAVLEGHTRLGRDNQIFSHAAIGTAPQDKKYAGEASRLEIGDRNVIREFTTLNPGTAVDRNVTSIGNGNLLMAYVHVAHDCAIADDCIFSNGAQLAGHVIVGSGVTIGGMSGIHQFVRLGTGAMIGGGSMVTLDVPPFCIAAGNRAVLHGLNLVGLKRNNIETSELKEIYQIVFRQGLRLGDAIARARAKVKATPQTTLLLDFLASSERGICRPDE